MEPESDSDVLWEQRFSELRQWKKLSGHCNVPKAEGKLGRWVVRQRELNKKSKLEEERQKRLDTLGLVWNTNEAAWEQKYLLLVKYKETHGHCCVPISDNALGMWVAKMRANRRRSKLPQHRIRKLESISFVWNTAESDWKEKYNRLLDFRTVNGHSCVPFNEGELGWWVNTQRQNKRKGKILPHREKLLNEAFFIWAPQEFLAARRKQLATARANDLSLEPLYQCHNVHFMKEQNQNNIHHFSTSAPHNYNNSVLKRSRPSYLESSILRKLPSEAPPLTHSPTSVKRFKWTESFGENHGAAKCTPVEQTTSLPTNHIGVSNDFTVSHPPPIHQRPFHHDKEEYTAETVCFVSNELPSERQSVEALLSLATNQFSTSSISNATSDADRQANIAAKYRSHLRSNSILSNICGIQSIKRHRASPSLPHERITDFSIPPISSLRGFEQAKVSRQSETA